MAISDHYNKSAIIKRHDGTTDELGLDYADANWDTVDTIKCALETVSGSKMFISGTDQILATHRLYCDTDVTTFTEIDRFEIDSASYSIVFIEDIMEREHHLEVMLLRLKGADTE